MNVKFCNATLQSRISRHAPVFHNFMKSRKLYKGLTDAIIIDRGSAEEPTVITSHSESEPFEYYEWVKRGATYHPHPVGPVQLNRLLQLNYIYKK